MTQTSQPMPAALEAALAAFESIRLEITNESAQHKGHAGDDGSGETHFAITVLSSRFEGLGRLERQRAVMEAVKPLFYCGLHALRVQARTPDEP